MPKMDEPRWNSDMAAFREEVAKAKHIVVLTGAGVSAESGVPTFRGAGGLWRTYSVTVLHSMHMHADLHCKHVVKCIILLSFVKCISKENLKENWHSKELGKEKLAQT